MSALMQRLLPEGAIPTEALIAQLKRREMEREKAAYAAAGGARTAAMKTDEGAAAAEEKERLAELRRPRTVMYIERPRERAAGTNESRWRTATERETREAKKDARPVPPPRSRMPTGVRRRTQVPVNPVALATSLQTQFE